MLVLALGAMSCDKLDSNLPECNSEVMNYNILGSENENQILIKDLLVDERFIASETYINDYHCKVKLSINGISYEITIHSQMGLTQMEEFKSIFSDDINENKKILIRAYFN